MEMRFSAADCLEWAVAEVIGKDELERRLHESRPLKVKLGIDPTSPNIHLGRSIPIWRLRAFQELGHEIHLIIGDFTGQIGDTSDKDAERPMLSAEVVQENLRGYLDQLWMILNPAKKDQVHIHYNAEWLSKLTLGEISQLADSFSVNSFIKRELIVRRLESGSRVSLREMLYPLMQGYDSLAVEADVELGGTDQRFNLLAGRTLQEARGLAPQAIIMNPLIAGTDGRKMSSSWGNVIALLDTPEDKFGKLMAIEDSLMGDYLNFLPFSVQPFTSEQLEERLKLGENPRDIKLELARSLVALYHGEKVADAVAIAWTAQFSEGKRPEDIPTFSLATLEHPQLLDALVASGLVPSRSEGRRVLEQGGVRVNDAAQADSSFALKPGMVIEKGKRGFVRVVA